MRVLLTGATGFIGEHLARRFVAAGAEVHALVRAPAARLMIPGVTAVEADLADPSSLAVLDDLPDFDVVCHFAADTRMDVGEEELVANVAGTRALVERLGERLRGKRLIFASSIAAVDREKKPRGPLTADSPPAPRSAYARSKLECERLLAGAAAEFGFHHASLRLGTVYGPGQTKGGVVSLAEAARGGGIAARLPWTGRISFVYVEDVAEVALRIAELDEPAAGTWFLAEGRGHTMADTAEILRDVQGGGAGPLPFPRFALRMINWALWLPVIRNFAPWSLRCALADTILCDTDPLKTLVGMEWTSLAEGLAKTFGRPDPATVAARAEARPEGRPIRSLVSGATGYLGQALVRALADAHGPENVIGLHYDPLPESEQDTAEELKALGVRLLSSDLLARPVFPTTGIEFDVLYHLAAETDSAASEERLRVNPDGTRNILETLGPLLAGKRVVLAGATAAVDRSSRPKTLMVESDPETPRTAYGRSKLESERILAEVSERLGFAWAVPRFSPVWTPRLDFGFLGAFREQVTGRSILRRVGWPGRVTIIRQKDAVAILRHFGETGVADGRAVLVGDGVVYTYAKLIADIRAADDDAGWAFPFPGFLWALIRWGAWLPVAKGVVPWRLSCLLGDDLAVDNALLVSLYSGHLTTWEESRPEFAIGEGHGE